MARKAETYRAAKRNDARTKGILNTWKIVNRETPHQFDRRTLRAMMREAIRRTTLQGAAQ